MHNGRELVDITYDVKIQEGKDIAIFFFEGESNISVPRRHVEPVVCEEGFNVKASLAEVVIFIVQHRYKVKGVRNTVGW